MAVTKVEMRHVQEVLQKDLVIASESKKGSELSYNPLLESYYVKVNQKTIYGTKDAEAALKYYNVNFRNY